ncbi:putative eukaryotic translation initiation factor 3 subunit EifCa [Aspergillus fischeri NRRL 181]|uniref:Eukaryotic translation initiation factor 3 subunit A n=1 Tax=Neosartorya fischeri (strain ATCC 1020 / DSM 3700 / CBS 544.65 / FGSC A1164 / JCM 1740 / NRRL 181 / WB 181) TaxID=331117 RepID=EIF3A_NEOFI|nr:eukaryotic translation initiation factor 3 subunit EifCa, putative [Aspergillus fischeri NRRL 181]A1D4A7.1 RecName: Full=Eukaryotic translation initiation factor 3 subunit A; Short=eIF3a; AltName: Full=Eukaryotic translation initiation factor 3 110 kDa subunit homolog; Short=eIF3 p110; AltName: Full=Translation initiation factor eIF3, p110 subunit homolog [Aspergillus fischeri NRRL 181]EAW23250.1 eukaryotic translation initiation factor 3 subunit EifCa, putative [Aspergillus fischeri NRRL 181]
MPPPPHIKPENVLKRAQELIAVGQAPAALNVLHEHVTSKRTRSSPIASLEPVMLLFVELCVDLRKGKAAKDGLYQYKNIAQNTNVGTIEVVLKKFIELAEKKVTEAQAKADEIQSSLESAAPSSNVEDLEAIETPETILLATVSGEQSRDRTDRAVVTPWLKFLWETYRTVLEILKNNARLEVMYQTTALQAFQFCLKYTRKTEFRRLCELLRNHVQNAAKYSAQMHAINLSDPDTLQRHLDTRFQQLNVAVELELWQEAFRSIEDIHTLLSLSKRPAKNVMMANYYEKLARIFLVSENYLFHAAAWNRYYNLLRQSAVALAAGQGTKKENPSVTEADMTKAASFVLLSALSIPVISTSRSRGALVDVDEARKNKNTRLTNLLGMAQPPSRAVLFRDALNKGLLKRARPEIRDLYNILEVDFHPLSICKKITPILKQIGADPEMEKYVLPLQQVILTRLFQQLSQVYESVELKFVYELAQFPDPFQITPAMIEKFIMNGCKKGDLAIRVDHTSGVLTFDTDIFSSAKALHSGSAAGSAESDVGSVQRLQNTPAEIARLQLTRLAKTLHVTCMYVDPSYNEARIQAKKAAQARAEAGAAKEHEETLARRVLIEKKKEAATDALQRKQREEETRKRIRTQQLQEAEKQRLLDEQREREKKRLKDEQDRIRQQELKKQLEELKSGVKGIDISEIDLEDMDANRLRAIKLAQLEKEKNELNERIRTTAKRIDHLERAFRREELKHIPEDYEAQKKRDMELYEAIKAETLKEAEEKHKEAVALKHRLSRLVPVFSSFRKEVSEKRHEEFEKRRKAAEREFEAKKKQRVKEVQERRRREKAEREAEERRRKEEEERAKREEEERIAKEEERRRVLAEEKAKREEERKRLDEIALRQKQREEEAEARRAARKSGLAEPPTRAAEPERPAERTAPRLNLASRTGGAPSWRERQAAKEATGAAPAPAPVPAPAAAPAAAPAPAAEAPKEEVQLPRRTGGYVPPHLRSGASASPAAPPSNGPAPEKYVPRHMRESSSSQPPSRTQTPPAPAAAASSDKPEGSPAPQKWVPRWKQQQQ